MHTYLKFYYPSLWTWLCYSYCTRFHSVLINCIILSLYFFFAAGCFGSTNSCRVFSLCILCWAGWQGVKGDSVGLTGGWTLAGMQEKIAAAYRKRFKLLSSFVSAICWHFNALKHRPTSYLTARNARLENTQ